MSSTVTVRPARGVRGIGLVAIIAGIVMIVAGVMVWILVATQLAGEKITVSPDAPFMGGIFQGDRVAGPLTAFAQADIIEHHALDSTGGQTYAQLAQDDPQRSVVMTASFLRASLFTSVVAFGICALVIALGVLFLLVGGALRRLASGPAVAVGGIGAQPLTSDADAYGRHAGTAAPTAAPTATPTATVAPVGASPGGAHSTTASTGPSLVAPSPVAPSPVAPAASGPAASGPASPAPAGPVAPTPAAPAPVTPAPSGPVAPASPGPVAPASPAPGTPGGSVPRRVLGGEEGGTA